MNELTPFDGPQPPMPMPDQLPATPETTPETVMPHSVEAEQQLLGAILTNNDVYDRIASVISAEHFYDPVHTRIYEIAAARISKNALASPVTLKAFMEDDEGLKELGGPAYLAKLAGASISAFAVRDYAQMIYDLAIRRELIGLGQDIADKAAKAAKLLVSEAEAKKADELKRVELAKKLADQEAQAKLDDEERQQRFVEQDQRALDATVLCEVTGTGVQSYGVVRIVPASRRGCGGGRPPA